MEATMLNGITPGNRQGHWTVLDDYRKTKRGEIQWLCKCDCGTYRFVLERSLRSGASNSCGCTKQRASQNRAYDLTGKQFGDLAVLGRSNKKKIGHGVCWWCRCSCGDLCEIEATFLVTGKKTHCGCKEPPKKYAYADISGQKFNMLTALYPTSKRERGSIVWHCRCECGNEKDVPYDWLLYSNSISCGCRKLQHNLELNQFIARADGTSIDYLRSQKIPENNTTGVKGVYYARKRYVAKIVFQKKQYHLGTYTTLEEAAVARRKAEEELNKKAVAFYEKWKLKADADPEWAQKNPIRFCVLKSNGQICLHTSPQIDSDGINQP